jgi:hypothetical protein
LAALLATTLACGAASSEKLPTTPSLTPSNGDVIFTTTTARRFYLVNGTSEIHEFQVGAKTTFTGAISSYEQMAALYKAGAHLTATVMAPYSSDAYEVRAQVSGPTATQSTLQEGLAKCGTTGPYPPTAGVCPQPGDAEWTTSGNFCNYSSRACVFIYPWTVFRADGDFHSMSELAAASNQYSLCVAADGYVVGYQQTHATSVRAWRCR